MINGIELTYLKVVLNESRLIELALFVILSASTSYIQSCSIASFDLSKK